MPAMEASKARVSFMSLSPELRNRIYELVVKPRKIGDGGVDGERAICVQDACIENYDDVGDDLDYGNLTAWRKQPAITKVSRQVRAETLPMYYGGNLLVAYLDVSLDIDDNPLSTARHWLERIGKANAALIKHFEIRASIALDVESDPEDLMAACLSASKLGLTRASVKVLLVKFYGPGEMWYEAPGCHHVRSENAGNKEAAFYANFIIDTDKLEGTTEETVAAVLTILDVDVQAPI
ncbi:hypothetical protein LTR85_005966 [Meristemomyces frigidus]|nr:hypothetical protein LTR85_005966 [Meristemomyces frigidus]